MKSRIELVCLGVGKGASYVMKGVFSTAFCILVNDIPYMLIDAGAGIGLSCQKHVGRIPSNIYITHNHMDHTGDLPILLGVIGDEVKPKVFGHKSVLDIVKLHRMHDPLVKVDDLAHWIESDKNNKIYLDHNMYLEILMTKHSYICYGFTLFYHDCQILSYSADTPYDEELFLKLIQAPKIIINARDKSTYDHVSFTEVEKFIKNLETDPKFNLWFAHYESTTYSPSIKNLHLLKEGERIVLLT